MLRILFVIWGALALLGFLGLGIIPTGEDGRPVLLAAGWTSFLALVIYSFTMIVLIFAGVL